MTDKTIETTQELNEPDIPLDVSLLLDPLNNCDDDICDGCPLVDANMCE